MAKEQADDARVTYQEGSKRTMRRCVNRFHFELQIISRVIKEVAATFETDQPKIFISVDEEELKMSVPKLTISYDEISESDFPRNFAAEKAHESSLE